MKSDQIFIANLRKCTKHNSHAIFQSSTEINGQSLGEEIFGFVDTEDELYKENAILIKMKNGGYVDIDVLRNYFDYLKLFKDITPNGFVNNGIFLSTMPSKVGDVFVDYKTIEPYYDFPQVENISFRSLKRIR